MSTWSSAFRGLFPALSVDIYCGEAGSWRLQGQGFRLVGTGAAIASSSGSASASATTNFVGLFFCFCCCQRRLSLPANNLPTAKRSRVEETPQPSTRNPQPVEYQFSGTELLRDSVIEHSIYARLRPSSRAKMAYNPYGGKSPSIVCPLSWIAGSVLMFLTIIAPGNPYGPPPSFNAFPGSSGAPGMAPPPGLGIFAPVPFSENVSVAF